MKGHDIRAFLIGLLVLLASPVLALDLGRTGISLNPPARGWKVEQHRDAAIEVWHLRAESWDPPPASGLIAVTVSMLEGDPWPDPTALRDAVASLVRTEFLQDISAAVPFELGAGRFQIAGEDVTGALGLGQAGSLPARARLLVIRTGSGALLITAFAIGAQESGFEGLFGIGGILTAQGPGSEALNGPAGTPAVAPLPLPEAVPENAPDPGVDALLKDMQSSFGEEN